jgi:hypothetical protein
VPMVAARMNAEAVNVRSVLFMAVFSLVLPARKAGVLVHWRQPATQADGPRH